MIGIKNLKNVYISQISRQLLLHTSSLCNNELHNLNSIIMIIARFVGRGNI
jgi:hypothetical protein